MARPLRIQYPGAFYHVMNRGASRVSIFKDRYRDRKIFLHKLAEAVERWKIRIHAYSLMDNHYHLLIETPLPNLSRAMRHIDGVYTQCLNKINGTDGPLFRGRFKSILVQKESYFLELLRYIHLNGVKAGAFARLEDDEFCSYNAYMGHIPRPNWLTVSMGLAMFSATSGQDRRLLEAFIKRQEPSDVETIFSQPRWPAILGTKDFVEEIRLKHRLGLPRAHEEKPQEKRIVEENLPTAENVLTKVAAAYGTPKDALLIRDGKHGSFARQAAIFFLSRACHLTYAEIGDMAGGIQDSTVGYIINKAAKSGTREMKLLRENWKLET